MIRFVKNNQTMGLEAQYPEYISAGTAALKIFHDASVQYPEYPFKTFDDFINYVNNLSPSFINFYGKALVTSTHGGGFFSSTKAGFDPDILKEVNTNFAIESQGKVPTNRVSLNSFSDILADASASVSTYISQDWQFVKNTAITAIKLYTGYKIAGVIIALSGVAVAFMKMRSKKQKTESSK